jgi:hypothetical protein
VLSDGFRSEDWGSRFVWNIGACVPESMASYPRDRNFPNYILQFYSSSETEKVFWRRIPVGELPTNS